MMENAASSRLSQFSSLLAADTQDSREHVDFVLSIQERQDDITHRREIRALDIATRVRVEKQAEARGWLSLVNKAIGAIAFAVAVATSASVATGASTIETVLHAVGLA